MRLYAPQAQILDGPTYRGLPSVVGPLSRNGLDLRAQSLIGLVCLPEDVKESRLIVCPPRPRMRHAFRVAVVQPFA
jgi:hypothetical protein